MLGVTDSDTFEASKKGPWVSFRKMKPLEPYIGAIEERVREVRLVDGAGRIFETLACNAPYPLGGWFDPIRHLCYTILRNPQDFGFRTLSKLRLGVELRRLQFGGRNAKIYAPRLYRSDIHSVRRRCNQHRHSGGKGTYPSHNDALA